MFIYSYNMNQTKNIPTFFVPEIHFLLDSSTIDPFYFDAWEWHYKPPTALLCPQTGKKTLHNNGLILRWKASQPKFCANLSMSSPYIYFFVSQPYQTKFRNIRHSAVESVAVLRQWFNPDNIRKITVSGLKGIVHRTIA